jgi:hypothetical protein
MVPPKFFATRGAPRKIFGRFSLDRIPPDEYTPREMKCRKQIEMRNFIAKESMLVRRRTAGGG